MVALRRTLIAVLLLGAHSAAALDVTVNSVPVANGYFLAENCTPEPEDPKNNACICKADIVKAQVNNLAKGPMTTINNQLSQVPEQLASESCGGKPTPAPDASILTNNATANYDVVYKSPQALSVLLTYSTSPAGAAHPIPGSEGYTFDIASGKTLDIPSLLTPEQLTKANAFIAEELLKKHGEIVNEDARERTAPYLTDAGCENCTLYYTKDGWNLRFAVYAVAAYAAGEPTITIPTTIIPDPETLIARKK